MQLLKRCRTTRSHSNSHLLLIYQILNERSTRKQGAFFLQQNARTHGSPPSPLEQVRKHSERSEIIAKPYKRRIQQRTQCSQYRGHWNRSFGNNNYPKRAGTLSSARENTHPLTTKSPNPIYILILFI